jgi:hypothetical protein
MTGGRGNMGIFSQIRHFSKVLIVWRAKVQALVVRGAIHKMTSSLGGKIVFFP